MKNLFPRFEGGHLQAHPRFKGIDKTLGNFLAPLNHAVQLNSFAVTGRQLDFQRDSLLEHSGRFNIETRGGNVVGKAAILKLVDSKLNR